MRHSNILFIRNPLVTQTEGTVDPYHGLRQLSCFKTRLSIFLNYLSHAALNCELQTVNRMKLRMSVYELLCTSDFS